ncbi:hypothetical protein Slin14017_G097910 [Septoria linicola]|nr:hypothetical protein Slin14017_G097910 [Septoria linicola]
MPRDKRKPKAPPSNAKAMCDILHLLDTSSPNLFTKEQRVAWIEEHLLRHHSYPYPGTKKDVGKHHTAESLHEAITYAVRDGKKDEFKDSTKGEKAIGMFFSVGKDMLKREYLVGIGYEVTIGTEVSRLKEDDDQLHDLPQPTDEAEAARPTPARARPSCWKALERKVTAPWAGGGDIVYASTSRVTRQNSQLLADQAPKTLDSEPQLSAPSTQQSPATQEVPRLLRIEHGEPHEEQYAIVYEPVKPILSPGKRKYHVIESDPYYGEPSATRQVSSPPPDEKTGRLLDVIIRQDLIRLRETIAELSKSLCAAHTPLHLKGWPSPALLHVYADVFGCSRWRHIFEDLVERSGMQSFALLQAVIWTFLDLHIFRPPLPWPRLTAESILDDSATAIESAIARWKHEVGTVLCKISLERLQDVVFINSTIKPTAESQVAKFKAVVSEHLADDSISPFPGVRRIIAPREVATLQRICEAALILKGRMDAGPCEYRLIRHKPASPICHGDSPTRHGRAPKRRKDVVALTIAPGLERADVREGGLNFVDAFVTIEPAMIGSSQAG